MVLQKNTLFSGSITENLRWGDENASEEDIKRACSLACADEFIDQFPDGYNTYIEQGGTMQTLKTILGHSSITLTMDLYSHVLPDIRKKEMDMISIDIG